MTKATSRLIEAEITDHGTRAKLARSIQKSDTDQDSKTKLISLTRKRDPKKFPFRDAKG
jgi:hypothetical protein